VASAHPNVKITVVRVDIGDIRDSAECLFEPIIQIVFIKFEDFADRIVRIWDELGTAKRGGPGTS